MSFVKAQIGHSLEKQYVVVKIKQFSMDISANPRAWRGAHLPVYGLQAKEILFQFSVLGERGGKYLGEINDY